MDAPAEKAVSLTTEEKASTVECYRCQSVIPAEAARCPGCGSRQSRHCFCGAEIRRDVAVCPQCGAKWSAKVRIRRRSHSKRLKREDLLGAAAIGAVATLLLAGLVNLVISTLAKSATPDHVLPPLGQRLPLAAQAVSTWISHVGQVLPTLGPFIIVAVVGAGIGTFIYLAHSGYFKQSKRKHHHGDHVLVRRRRS